MECKLVPQLGSISTDQRSNSLNWSNVALASRNRMTTLGTPNSLKSISASRQICTRAKCLHVRMTTGVSPRPAQSQCKALPLSGRHRAHTLRMVSRTETIGSGSASLVSPILLLDLRMEWTGLVFKLRFTRSRLPRTSTTLHRHC